MLGVGCRLLGTGCQFTVQRQAVSAREALMRSMRFASRHPYRSPIRLRKPGALAYLGVDHVLVARRISVGKFMNFSPVRPIVENLKMEYRTRLLARS